MARIPAATRENVPQNQLDEFDQMTQSLGGVPAYGPGSIMIHVPKAHQAATALNNYLRNESSLPAAALELAMLLAAREHDCQHIWNAHAAAARAAGVQDPVVDAIRDRKDLPPLTDLERAVINYAREFFQHRKIGRGAFQDAIEQFGKQGLIELTLVIGNYSFLAYIINAFDPDLPPNRPEPLLPG